MEGSCSIPTAGQECQINWVILTDGSYVWFDLILQKQKAVRESGCKNAEMNQDGQPGDKKGLLVTQSAFSAATAWQTRTKLLGRDNSDATRALV
ncbi:hypothetical protein ElyMa_001842900 [Elysia marginata]|uniref:Uncharacterized protein n=1 Tax=Elysia marginata TaxID=1093978 RepID=A0AAV4EKM8_9GAST|nr:hypothetical protein ElyMa_001842900 [Elysia marginata]